MFPKLLSQEPRLTLLAALAFGFTFAFSGVGCVMPPCECSQPAVGSAPPPPNAGSQPPAKAAAPREGWVLYRVQPGDTLARIAACHGASVEEISRENAIFDRNRILVGWSLRVRGKDLCAGGAAPVATMQRPKPAAPRTEPRASAGRGLAPAATGIARPSAQSAGLVASDARAAELLESARADYDAALFDAALRGAESAAQALARAPRNASTDAQRARAHLLAGMSAAGLEERERALAEFERAFALDPDAELAPEDQSPRLLELFQLARGRRAERMP